MLTETDRTRRQVGLPGTAPEEADAAVWRALADPSRRRILDLLRDGARTTGDLCAQFEVSRFAVMKHLRVLEEAGLVVVERRGRERFNHLNPVPILAIQKRWIDRFQAVAAERALRLKHLVETPAETPAENPLEEPPEKPPANPIKNAADNPEENDR